MKSTAATWGRLPALAFSKIRSEQKSRDPSPIFNEQQRDFYVLSALRESDCAVAHARSPQLFT